MLANNIVTFSDFNYLDKGIAFIDSCLRHSGGEHLNIHYLCMDEKCQLTLEKLYSTSPNLTLHTYTMKHLETDPSLHKVMSKERIDNGNSDFHWSLSSFFTRYILNNVDVDSVLYSDSDILFYKNPLDIIRLCEHKSIGLHTHRHIEARNISKPGYYNVGVMFFKRNQVGLDCLDFWVDKVLDVSNCYATVYGTCGDQKYVELFEEFWPDEIVVFDQENQGGVGHGAPWNSSSLMYKNGKVKYGGGPWFPLYFFHFSHFTYNFEENWYKPARNFEWGDCIRSDGIKYLYEDYFSKLKKARNKYHA